MFCQTNLIFIFLLYLPERFEILDKRVDDFSSDTILLYVISRVSTWNIWTPLKISTPLFPGNSPLKMTSFSSPPFLKIWAEVQPPPPPCKKGGGCTLWVTLIELTTKEYCYIMKRNFMYKFQAVKGTLIEPKTKGCLVTDPVKLYSF